VENLARKWRACVVLCRADSVPRSLSGIVPSARQ